MLNKLKAIFLTFFCYLNLSLLAEEIWISPTEKYVSKNSIEEVKYNLKLDYVTLEHKPLFDKAIAQETFGFFGYYSASVDFRVYQDLIRIVFEEVLGILIPEDFHFVAVPLYSKRFIHDLEDISFFAFEDNLPIRKILQQLLPFNLSLYANHKKMGFCPARNFSLSAKHANSEDLYWLFESLGLDSDIIEKALLIANISFENENRVLLQFFDLSHESEQAPYYLIDKNSYPAWPSGYPYQNQALSDYILNSTLDYPPQFFLLLNDQTILNPYGPFVVKRYTKIQPSKIKSYEQELRNLIKTAFYHVDQRDLYLNELNKIWHNSQ
jgi:hypothetical protein